MFFYEQDPEAQEERWSHENETEKGGENEDSVQLQAQIQRLETENTDFLAALEDAMEQYKQQVKHTLILMFSKTKDNQLLDIIQIFSLMENCHNTCFLCIPFGHFLALGYLLTYVIVFLASEW